MRLQLTRRARRAGHSVCRGLSCRHTSVEQEASQTAYLNKVFALSGIVPIVLRGDRHRPCNPGQFCPVSQGGLTPVSLGFRVRMVVCKGD